MQSVNLADNVADRRILEKQENKTTHKEKTQWIRSVQKKQEIVRSFNKMMPVSDTYRRTAADDYAVAANASKATSETVRFREWKSEIPRTRMQYTFGVRMKVQQMVTKATERLKELVKDEADTFFLCQRILVEFLHLLNSKAYNNPDTYKDNNHYIKLSFAPYYHKVIGPALEILQSEADRKTSWEYTTKLIEVTQLFEFMETEEGPDRRSHEKTLAKLYRQYLDNELSYMEFMKDSLLTSAVEHASDNINKLLADNSPVRSLNLLNENEIAEFMKKKDDRLDAHYVCSKTKDACADKMMEECDEMERRIRQEPSNILLKRNYNDALHEQFNTIIKDKSNNKNNENNENNENNNQMMQSLFVLKKMAGLCYKYTEFVNVFNSFRKQLEAIIKRTAKPALLAIQSGSDNDHNLKAEILELTGCFHEDGWLHGECADLYLSLVQPHPITDTTTPKNKITDSQCIQELDKIIEHANSTSEDRYWDIAEMLKRFLEKHEDLIKELPTKATLESRIGRIKKIIYENLVKNIVDELKTCIHRQIHENEISYRMHNYQDQFIQFAPYTFIFRNNRIKQYWLKLACRAWLPDLEKIRAAASYSKADADALLLLKYVAPDIPNSFIWNQLKKALGNFFQFMLTHDTDPELTEKITELSAWIDHLGQIYPIDKPLQNYNEQWKKRHPGTASKKAEASPDTAIEIMPVPDVVVSPQGASDDHLNETQPLTRPSQTLAPTTAQQPPRKKSVLPYCALMTQLPVKIESHPTPMQQPPLFQPVMSYVYGPHSSSNDVQQVSWRAIGEIEQQASLPPTIHHEPPQIPIQNGAYQQQSPCIPVADFSPARPHPTPTRQPLSTHHGAPTSQQHFPTSLPAQVYSCQPQTNAIVQPQQPPLFQSGMSYAYEPHSSSSDVQQVSWGSVEKIEQQIPLPPMIRHEPPQIPIQNRAYQQQSPCIPVADFSPARPHPTPTLQLLSTHHWVPMGQPCFPTSIPTQVCSCQSSFGAIAQPQWQRAPQQQSLFQQSMSYEYEPEYSFNNDTQQVLRETFTIEEKIKWQISSLSQTLRELKQRSIQGEAYQQSSCMPVASDVVFQTDNINIVEGGLHLLLSVQQYLQQKNSGLPNFESEIHLPTNPESNHHLAFKKGIDHLAKELARINGKPEQQSTIREHLMQLGHDDGKSKIGALFRMFTEKQHTETESDDEKDDKNKERLMALSNLNNYIRNSLLSIHNLMREA